MDLGAGQLIIGRGKGGKGRVVGFSAQTAAAVDRYLRVRRRHRLASSGALWRSKTRTAQLGHGGLRFALSRAAAAGEPGFHIHKLRHTFAVAGRRGREGGLMATTGWSSRDMLDRYSFDCRSRCVPQPTIVGRRRARSARPDRLVALSYPAVSPQDPAVQ